MLNSSPPALANLTKEQLAILINQYDIVIAKLTKWFNAITLTKGSILISGQMTPHKEFHEILVLGLEIEMPQVLLNKFFGDYCQDLIGKRLRLVHQLEALDNPVLQLQAQESAPAPGPVNTLPDSQEIFCPVCIRLTDHHLHQSEMGLHWQCDGCSNINTNHENL